MVRSISSKISPGSFGKIDKIASARTAISETPYDFLPKVQLQHFIKEVPKRMTLEKLKKKNFYVPCQLVSSAASPLLLLLYYLRKITFAGGAEDGAGLPPFA